MLRTVSAIRYVTPLREGGSLPALVEADDDGLYVVKLRGAGQGVKALVAEVVVGEIARALGLLVPEIVLVNIDPELAAAEPDPEIKDLVEASAGANVGLDFLPEALTYSPAAGHDPDPEVAADVVWLDALAENVDRTPRNPNVLIWHGRLWLIDHGAALYRQHAGLDPAAARGAFPAVATTCCCPRGIHRRGRRSPRGARHAGPPRTRSSTRCRPTGSADAAPTATSTTSLPGWRSRVRSWRRRRAPAVT